MVSCISSSNSVFSDGDPGTPTGGSFIAAASGDYIVDLYDSWGDGWAGDFPVSGTQYHTLTVSVDGVPVLTDITLLTGLGPETFNFYAAAGDLVEFDFTVDGLYASECSYFAYYSGASFVGDEVTVQECGDYTFAYTVRNGPCLEVSTVNVSFYDSPEMNMQDDDEDRKDVV